MEKEVRGLIFDIQGYSVHDGPGVRTLIFMKGCPLHCEWCSNPEGMYPFPEIMFRNTKCVHVSNSCNRCLQACPLGAIQENPAGRQNGYVQLIIDRQSCRQCEHRRCLEVCFFEGLRLCGEWKSVDEIMHVLQRNRHYWGGNGGVSFSGGEPLFQPEFLRTMLDACREEKIHVALETTAYAKSEVFLDLLKDVDFAFIDVKHMDSEQHRAKTGVKNELILHNIEALASSGYRGRLVLRMPVIENFNDSDENIFALAAFMKKVGLFEINLLPFHRLGASKWTQLGKTYVYGEQSGTSQEYLLHLQDIFLGERIACYVGSDTPF